jgi:hypothetical protein
LQQYLAPFSSVAYVWQDNSAMSANVLFAKAFQELAIKQMENAANLLTGTVV